MKKLLVFALLALLVVGCASVSLQPPAEKWKEVTADGFSIYVPGEWKYERLQGTDSWVGEFSGNGMTLSYDFGAYSNSLSEYKGSESATHETIDGKEARVVMDKEKGFSGIYIPDASEGRRSNLTIYAKGLTPNQMDVALKIFRTIKFRK